MSDTAGNFLFYVAGEVIPGVSNYMHVWNKNHNIMQNGEYILPNKYPEPMNGAVIIPKPGSDNFYYIFTVDDCFNSYADGFRYSIVDMSANGGLGEVTEKRILIRDNVAEILGAIKHSNNTDYWVIVHELYTNKFLAYLITNGGISTNPIITNIGYWSNSNIYNSYNSKGQEIIFSLNGEKIGISLCNDYQNTGDIDTLELYNFDRTTGILSNRICLPADTLIHCFCFSPNNSKLYIESGDITDKVHQYDLTINTPEAILNSKTLIKVITNANNNEFNQSFQIGPDGKIYGSCEITDMLTVIENPNEPGLLCNYTPNVFSLNGKYPCWGFPNIIQSYYDNSITNVTNLFSDNIKFQIYPNPCEDYIIVQNTNNNIYIDGIKNNNFNFKIYNIYGKLSKEGITKIGEEINVSSLSPGIYLFQIYISNTQIINFKFLKL
jgi:hypothetical protein